MTSAERIETAGLVAASERRTGKVMRRRFFLALGALLFTATTASADSEPHVGEVMIFGFNFCPHGWTAANGQTLTLSQNTALFSLYSTRFGGNGMTTFGVPKQTVITGPVGGNVPSMTVCVATQGVFPQRP